MTFFNPLYLWSMLGILIPIAIHLWSRQKVVTIKVGSTKLLQESEPKQTSTIRPNELWLLFLRILTILLLSLILSEPQLKSTEKNIPLLYVIEPSLFQSEELEGFLDDIPEETIRVFGKEFPELANYDAAVEDNGIPNYWQLTTEMNALAADSVIVLTKGLVSGLKGRRPVIASHINWSVLNSDEETEHLVQVYKRGDSLDLRTVLSNAAELKYEKKTLPATTSEVLYNSTNDSVEVNENSFKVRQDETINILIVFEASFVREQQYIRAAYKAIAKLLKRPISLHSRVNADVIDLETYDASIWLGVKPIAGLKNTLIFKPDSLATELIKPGATENEYFLTDFLNSENSVKAHLAEKLLHLLQLNEELNKKIQANDKRVVSTEELKPVSSEKIRITQRASLVDISPWLWMLLLLILCIERIIAKYRRQ